MAKKININLSVFLEDPQREVAVREFARICHVAPATASAHLHRLAKEGILQKRQERNLSLFRGNEGDAAYKRTKIFENFRRIQNSGLLDTINAQLQHPLAVFLFGSYAKAENRKGSDIDLFVLTRTKKTLDLKKFEGLLGSPIQLFVYTPIEVEDIKKTNPHLINNIINGIRLSGFWEVL